MRGRYLCCICLPLLLWFALTGILGGGAAADTASLPVKEGQTVTISGTVYKQEFKSSYQSIYLKNISFISGPDSKPASEAADFLPKTRILVYLKSETDIAIGAHVTVWGEVSFLRPAANPGGFDEKSYYGAKKIGLILRKAQVKKKDRAVWPLPNMIMLLRRRLIKLAYCLTDEETAGILCAVVLGDRSNLETEIRDLYQDMGLIHLFSVSGLHITMLGMGLYRLLKRAGLLEAAASGLCAGCMLAYACMTGMAYPAIRAVVMFLIYLLSVLTGRTYDLATALAVAALIILYQESGAASQAGFLMSFAAVAGVMLAGQWRTEKLRKSALGSSIGIQIMTLPLTAYFYYKIPLYSLGVNLLVLPLMPAVLGFGIAGMLAGLISQTAGRIILAPPFYILRAIKFICQKAHYLPLSTIITGKPPLLWILCYYPLLLCGFLLIKRKMRKSNKIDLIKLSFAIILLSGILGISPQKKFRMTFLDVGQGDGCCIENEKKSVWMIDGGSSSESALAAYCLEPFFESSGIDRVDCWMISHYDIDHVSGLVEILEGYQRNMTGNNMNGISIGRIFLPGIEAESEIHGRICELAERQQIPVSYVSRGDVLREGDMVLRVLAPDKDRQYSTENAASVVAEVTYFDFKALLTGDLEKDGEDDFLLNYPVLDVDVLKAAHHGSKYSTSEEFLESVSPEAVVISCKKNNRYGHPGEELLCRLKEYGCHVARTDRQGAVIVHADRDKWNMCVYISE